MLFLLIGIKRLFSFLFRFEDVKDHHDQEDGHRHTDKDAEEHLSDEVEAERLEEKQREMMDEHHKEGVTEEPDAVELSEVGFLDVLELLVA